MGLHMSSPHCTGRAALVHADIHVDFADPGNGSINPVRGGLIEVIKVALRTGPILGTGCNPWRTRRAEGPLAACKPRPRAP